MYETLVNEGFNVSYTLVINLVNSIERKRLEYYIRQEYIPGDIVEFDCDIIKILTKSIILI